MGFSVETVEVKSKGQILGSADVEVFDDIESAIAFFDEKFAGDDEMDGRGYVLGLVNSSHKNIVSNNVRNSLTRTVKPETELKRRAKEDPAVKAKLDALMKELGII